MFDKLREVEKRFQSIEEHLMQPGLSGKELAKLTKERAEIEDLVLAYKEFKQLKLEQEGAQEMLSESDDPELRALAKEELGSVEKKISEKEDQDKNNDSCLLIPTIVKM